MEAIRDNAINAACFSSFLPRYELRASLGTLLVAEIPTNNANVITINLVDLESDTSINVLTFCIFLVEMNGLVSRHGDISTTIERSKLICKWKTVGIQ